MFFTSMFEVAVHYSQRHGLLQGWNSLPVKPTTVADKNVKVIETLLVKNPAQKQFFFCTTPIFELPNPIFGVG